MSRLILVLIFSAVTANAAETAAPQVQAAPQRGVESSQQNSLQKSTPIDLRLPIDICLDLIHASCNRAEVQNDGTGTTQVASTLEARTIADANEFFRKNVAADPKFESALNKLLDDATVHGDLRASTGESCDLPDPQCRARIRAKMLEIYQDEFLNETRIEKNTSITWGCDLPKCKWTAHQADAFYRILRTQKTGALDEVLASYGGKFFETQNVDTRKRALEIFPKVREETKRVLATMGLSKEIQEELGKKLDGTIVSTDCHGASYDPHSFAWSNLMEDGSREIILCDGMLTGNSSDFAMVFALAHELTHQFDPCIIHFGPENFHYTMNSEIKTHDDFDRQNPFYDGLRCLRDPVKSVGAVKTSNYDEASFFHRLNLEAPAFERRSPYCEADRITESFADAIGAKVMASYFQNLENTGGKKFEESQWRAGLLNTATLIVQPVRCERQGLYWQSLSDEYASKHLRMNGLLMANTEIRRLAGCGSKKSAFQQCL